jgi:hypothetical protein
MKGSPRDGTKHHEKSMHDNEGCSPPSSEDLPALPPKAALFLGEATIRFTPGRTEFWNCMSPNKHH